MQEFYYKLDFLQTILNGINAVTKKVLNEFLGEVSVFMIPGVAIILGRYFSEVILESAQTTFSHYKNN